MNSKIKKIASAYRRHFSLNLLHVIDRYVPVRSQILHIGANKGQEAEIYKLSKFDSVIWIEGYPPFFDELVLNIEKYPGQIAFRVLASDVDGEKVIMRIADSEGASTLLEPEREFPGIKFFSEVELFSCRLDSFFHDNNIFLKKNGLLVLDVEGAELKALKGLGDLIIYFDQIICEISIVRNYKNGPVLKDIDEFLEGNGFIRARTWLGQYSGDALYLRNNDISTLRRLINRVDAFIYTIFYWLGVYRIKAAIRDWMDRK